MTSSRVAAVVGQVLVPAVGDRLGGEAAIRQPGGLLHHGRIGPPARVGRDQLHSPQPIPGVVDELEDAVVGQVAFPAISFFAPPSSGRMLSLLDGTDLCSCTNAPGRTRN